MRLRVQPQHQGASNGCGTTCLSMALEAWRPGRRAHAREAIDRMIRPFDMFTAPGDLRRYARAHGYQAEWLVEAGWGAVADLLDRGIPVLVLGGLHGRLHWMLAIGYEGVLEPGQGGTVSFIDPAAGAEITLPVEQADAFWAELRLRGLPTGVSRMLLAVADEGQVLDFPVRPWQPALAMLLAAQGVKDLAIAYDRHRPGRAVLGALELSLGLMGAVGNAIAGTGAGWRQAASQRPDWFLALLLSMLGWTVQLAGYPLAIAGHGLFLALGRERARTAREVWEERVGQR